MPCNPPGLGDKSRAAEAADIDNVQASLHNVSISRASQAAGRPVADEYDEAALTVRGTKGVDAWVHFGPMLYAMQCKGQETGTGCGRAGGDKTLQPEDAKDITVLFRAWKQQLCDASCDVAPDVALELMTTKSMTSESKRKARSNDNVVLARDGLLTTLGPVFGGIAARCIDQRVRKKASGNASAAAAAATAEVMAEQ